jgi:hypothetical protein
MTNDLSFYLHDGLNDDVMKKAYERLERADRAMIDELTQDLEDGLDERHTGRTPLMFGRKSTLELLAKLGVWMIDNHISVNEEAI